MQRAMQTRASCVALKIRLLALQGACNSRDASSQSSQLAQEKHQLKLMVGTKVLLDEIEYLVEERSGQCGFGSVFKVSRTKEAATA